MAVDLTAIAQALKIRYRDGMRTDINMRSPLWATFKRDIDVTRVEADTHRFLIKIAPSQNLRAYSTRTPNGEFHRTDGSFVPRQVDTNYITLYNPIRINHDTVVRANNGDASMIRALQKALEDLQDVTVFRTEWILCTGTGAGLLFALNGAPAAGVTAIKDYANISGSEIGILIEMLNLRNAWVNIADNVIAGGRYDTVRNGGAPVQITNWVKTLTAESVTFSPSPAGAVADDVVYFSTDNETPTGSTSTTAWPFGLPAVIDDYTRLSTFQTIAAGTDTATSFTSNTVAGGAAALSETLLNRLKTLCDMRGGGDRRDPTYTNYFYVCSPIMANTFAQELTTIANPGTASNRRIPHAVTEKGFKPYYGYEIDALHYSGTPFVTSQLAIRDELYQVAADDIKIAAPMDPEGDFLTAEMSSAISLRVPGSALTEFVWEQHWQTIAERRNTSGVIRNLATDSTL